MIFYSVKPKLQLINDNVAINQSMSMTEKSGINNFRIKPKQF